MTNVEHEKRNEVSEKIYRRILQAVNQALGSATSFGP